ncbi:hypothetical protein O181_016157 [Austropuccinia psidii MF-1]|uniref:Uncharacterized protein n=1 Tax=Austropuccinia psidii MF-1 TaxID=1389203 RepID=A0A9Q3GRE9_9BASI|nr:hypothetical protein [Austropuccinia psidii MF-1]
MSQFSEQTQKKFAKLQASHERMKTLTASMDKIFKTLQEGHSQLSKASEETNERLNKVFEEQHHRKRDRECYIGEEGEISISIPGWRQYVLSEREALKQLPEVSNWPRLSGTGEYDHMELMYYADGLFIDLPSIPDYWIAARPNTAFKGHASICVHRDEGNQFQKELAMVEEPNNQKVQQWYLDMAEDHFI